MLGFLGDLLGLNAGNATMDAANQNDAEIGKYEKRANTLIDTGAKKAGGYLGQVSGLYKPIAGATRMYADAMGLNGAGGNARATGAFQTNPGYEFQRDQGIQAIDRAQAARGSFQSGGAMADVLGFSQGLADQSYGTWLDRLGGLSDTALSGQTGALNNMANLATGATSQKLGVASDVVNGRMAANNQHAQGNEANKAGIASLGGNLLGMAGKAFGWGGF
jgi:hypothetical protein